MNPVLGAATVLRLLALLAPSGCAIAAPSATPSSSPTPADGKAHAIATPKPGTFGDHAATVNTR